MDKLRGWQNKGQLLLCAANTLPRDAGGDMTPGERSWCMTTADMQHTVRDRAARGAGVGRGAGGVAPSEAEAVALLFSAPDALAPGASRGCLEFQG